MKVLFDTAGHIVGKRSEEENSEEKYRKSTKGYNLSQETLKHKSGTELEKSRHKQKKEKLHDHEDHITHIRHQGRRRKSECPPYMRKKENKKI